MYESFMSQQSHIALLAQGLLDLLQAICKSNLVSILFIGVLFIAAGPSCLRFLGCGPWWRPFPNYQKTQVCILNACVSEICNLLGTLAVGGGTFGDIYKGHVYGDTVAVKGLRLFGCLGNFSKLHKVCSYIYIIFCDPFNMSISYLYTKLLFGHQMSHPNILLFLGIHTLESDVPRLCLLSPWLGNGDIVEFPGSSSRMQTDSSW